MPDYVEKQKYWLVRQIAEIITFMALVLSSTYSSQLRSLKFLGHVGDGYISKRVCKICAIFIITLISLNSLNHEKKSKSTFFICLISIFAPFSCYIISPLWKINFHFYLKTALHLCQCKQNLTSASLAMKVSTNAYAFNFDDSRYTLFSFGACAKFASCGQNDSCPYWKMNCPLSSTARHKCS